MPSFDIVSEVDTQELDNAVNQARKELVSRFDFKGITDEIRPGKDKIILTAEDASYLRGLREILIGKLSKRGVDLRNIEQDEPAISSVGHARQELKIQQGLEGNKAKEIIQAIKSQGFKVQSQLQDRQIRRPHQSKCFCHAGEASVVARKFEPASPRQSPLPQDRHPFHGFQLDHAIAHKTALVLSFAWLLQQFSSQHPNIGQIAVTFPEVEPVADYKFVFDFEPNIICIHLAGPLFLFAQQHACPNAMRSGCFQSLANGCKRETAVQNIIQNQNISADDIW